MSSATDWWREAIGCCASTTAIVACLLAHREKSGNRHVSRPSKPARKVLLSRPADHKSPESVIDHMVEMFGVAGSPGYPSTPGEMRRRVSRSVHHAYAPAGTARQMLAVIASGDRRKLLRTITAPTLVIHGASDPLVPLAVRLSASVSCRRQA